MGSNMLENALFNCNNNNNNNIAEILAYFLFYVQLPKAQNGF